MQSKPRQFKQPNPHSQHMQQQAQQQYNFTQPQTYIQPQQQSPMPPQQQYRSEMKPPKKHRRKALWIFVASVIVLAIILGVASIWQYQQPASTSTVQQPGSAPATRLATKSPLQQAPVASIQRQLQNIVHKSGAAYVGSATVSYAADFKYAHIVEPLPVTGDPGLDRARIKQDAFSLQKAIWQAHVSGVNGVQIIFTSDDAAPHRVATCELEQTTANHLNWNQITSDQAWSDYDSTWLSTTGLVSRFAQ